MDLDLRGMLDEPSLRAALAAGADPNAADADGYTALHLACMFAGAAGCVRALLEAGADPNAETGEGLRPLHLAAENFCADSCLALLAAGAGPFDRGRRGLTPFEEMLRALPFCLSEEAADQTAIALAGPSFPPERPEFVLALPADCPEILSKAGACAAAGIVRALAERAKISQGSLPAAPDKAKRPLL